MATEKTKQDIVEALLALLAARPYDAIGLRDVAARAEISLGELRDAYDGKLSILADFLRRTDIAVLGGAEEAADGDSPRDRLFDILMRRFDRLAPHKAALAHIGESARRDPALLLCLNGLALSSARFLLAAAGIGTGGLRGAARAQGLVLLIGRVSTTWQDDGDPDLSRTMAALDRALERAELWDRRSARAERIACRIGRKLERRGWRRPAAASEQPAA